MARPRDIATRSIGLLVIAAILWSLLASLGFLPGPPAYLWLLGLPLGLVWILMMYRAGFYQNVRARVWAEEFPNEQRVHVRPGGEFEWHPVGEMRPAVRHGIVHSWWETRSSPRYQARVVFDVPDEVPPRLLQKATKRALSSARRALPGRGKVRASAAHRDDAGPRSTVSVRLAVQGIGAEPTWTRAASEAFAREFLAALGRAGHDSTARGPHAHRTIESQDPRIPRP